MADQLIRLTDAENNESKLVLFPKQVSPSKGLNVEFDFYMYGGTGGDGLSFMLLDASKGVLNGPGGFGGSLGYANRFEQPGIKGGYLGVGFDSFGNFSNPGERIGGVFERNGGPGLTPNSVALRGSERNEYVYLEGTDTLPFNLSAGENATQAEAKLTALIEFSIDGLLSVSIDVNQDGDYLDPGEAVISDYDIEAENGAIPEKFLFGFAASTGDFTNIHEVGGFRVTNANGKEIPGVFTEYVLFLTEGDDNFRGTANGETIDALGGNDVVKAGGGDDVITGGLGKDKVFGQDGNDIFLQTGGPDIMVGGAGGDTFVFSGKNAKAALRTSILSSRAKIKDFNQREGDRFQLDYDNDYTTTGKSERPGSLYNVGTVKAKNLKDALGAVYDDIIPSNKKLEALQKGHAAIFQYDSKWYLTVNDNRLGYSEKNDLVADLGKLTKSDFASAGDYKPGKLEVIDYFV